MLRWIGDDNSAPMERSYRCCSWNLEIEPQANLEVTRIGGRFCGDLSERTSCLSEIQAACLSNLRPVGMVDKVVGFRVELETSPFVDGKLLLEGEIPVLEAWPVDRVANTLLQIEGTCGWRGEDWRAIRVCCGEVFASLTRVSGKLLQDLRSAIHHLKLALGAATEAADLSDTGRIVVCSDSARLAGLELSTSAQLPATNQLACKVVLVFEERQIVEIVDHQQRVRASYSEGPHRLVVL